MWAAVFVALAALLQGCSKSKATSAPTPSPTPSTPAPTPHPSPHPTPHPTKPTPHPSPSPTPHPTTPAPTPAALKASYVLTGLGWPSGLSAVATEAGRDALLLADNGHEHRATLKLYPALTPGAPGPKTLIDAPEQDLVISGVTARAVSGRGRVWLGAFAPKAVLGVPPVTNALLTMDWDDQTPEVKHTWPAARALTEPAVAATSASFLYAAGGEILRDEPTQEALVTGLGSDDVFGLAAVEGAAGELDHLFWSDSSRIRWAAKPTTGKWLPTTFLDKMPCYAGDLAYDAVRRLVIWGETNTTTNTTPPGTGCLGRIRAAPLDCPGCAYDLVRGLDVVNGLSLSGDRLYWSEHSADRESGKVGLVVLPGESVLPGETVVV